MGAALLGGSGTGGKGQAVLRAGRSRAGRVSGHFVVRASIVVQLYTPALDMVAVFHSPSIFEMHLEDLGIISRARISHSGCGEATALGQHPTMHYCRRDRQVGHCDVSTPPLLPGEAVDLARGRGGGATGADVASHDALGNRPADGGRQKVGDPILGLHAEIGR